MNDTTSNFWQAWNAMQWPDLPPPQHRLYYNPDGTPICYSMEDLPGDYIPVDAETYAVSSFAVLVINQKLVPVVPRVRVHRLRPSDSGMACDARDICVPVAESEPHIKWIWSAHEQD
jgi:hypothetical protein